MPEFNLGDIATYILSDHNCAGKFLTENISGMQSTSDQMEIFYSTQDMAAKVADDLPREFPVMTQVIEVEDIEKFMVLVTPN